MKAKDFICQNCGQQKEDAEQFHPSACCTSFKAGRADERARIAKRLDTELDSGENTATICRNIHFLMKELYGA